MHSLIRYLTAASFLVLLCGCAARRAPVATAARTEAVEAAEAALPAGPLVKPFEVEPQPAAPATKYADRTRLLLEAADKGRISLMLEMLKQGADINDKDDQGETALHKAVARGHRSAVVALLVRGADMGEKDAKGRTPLMAAAEQGQNEIVSLLLTPDTVQGLAGEVLKDVAADALKAALPKVTDRLSKQVSSSIDQTDQLGQTPLMKAAANGHLDCVKVLAVGFYAGDPTRQDRQGRTALILAAVGGHAAVVECLMQVPKLTLDEAKLVDNGDKNALQLAEAAGHKAVVKVLQREMLVKAAAEGDLATVKQLLETASADLPAGRVMRAAAGAGSNPVVLFLMEKWKDRPIEDKLRLMGVPPADYTGTALHVAASNGHALTVQSLLNAEWWKEKATLADFLGRSNMPTGGTTARGLAEFQKHAAVIELLDKKSKELAPGEK
jgi:ankyrin repeat protein